MPQKKVKRQAEINPLLVSPIDPVIWKQVEIQHQKGKARWIMQYVNRTELSRQKDSSRRLDSVARLLKKCWWIWTNRTATFSYSFWKLFHLYFHLNNCRDCTYLVLNLSGSTKSEWKHDNNNSTEAIWYSITLLHLILLDTITGVNGESYLVFMSAIFTNLYKIEATPHV